jgi:cytochrome P450
MILALDVIANYAFGRSYERLEHKDFDPAYAQSMHEGTAMFHFNKQIYWPFALLVSLPHWLATVLAPGVSMYVGFIRDCEKAIKAIKNGSYDPDNKASHPTLFHELLQNDVPAHEKSVGRLVQEAQIVVSAGTETTAWCLSVITFHLLSNPAILKKLRKELEEAIPDLKKPVPVERLEQLPYLSAVIQEGLRLSYGLSTRLPRVSPVDVMVFNDGKREWHIPPGVRVEKLIFVNWGEYLEVANPILDSNKHDVLPDSS